MMKTVFALLLSVLCFAICSAQETAGSVHTWEKTEITLIAKNSYANPYTDVEVWVDLRGSQASPNAAMGSGTAARHSR